jgi:predicted ATP-grasp superfamily ATP-dependent carboligase
MLDVNPRMGASFPLFKAVNGIDLARAYYLDMTGQRVPRSSASNGRKWIVGDLDFVSSLRYFTSGHLKLTQWLRSLRNIEESAYFATDDLLPFLVRLATDVIELHRRAFKKLAPERERTGRRPEAVLANSIRASSQLEA